MLLDPDTWELSERANEMLSATAEDLAGHRAAETHQAALELKTAPHASVHEAVDELRKLRHSLAADVEELGIATIPSSRNSTGKRSGIRAQKSTISSEDSVRPSPSSW
jgi:gamma-glutamyl:cysteine ligase YbdK (ATP-grasp superfamily)